MIFTTPRLTVRRALPNEKDIELYFQLWTDPQVMRNVGFPHGFRITREEIRSMLETQTESEYNRLLVIERSSDKQLLGECKLGMPDEHGLAETDVKLLPKYWRHRYGLETKRGLLDYLFTHTTCRVVQATPNVGNAASIRMQETVGGQRVSESVYEFPESMQAYTQPVHHYVYQVTRQAWEELPSIATTTDRTTHIRSRGEIPPAEQSCLDELLARAFGSGPNDTEEATVQWAEKEWNVLVYEGETLASNVEILTRTVTVADEPLRVGGIGGVATLPERRGRGLATLAMKAAQKFIRDELGLHFGLLITGSTRKSFYEGLGWQEIQEPAFFDQQNRKMKFDGITMCIALAEETWPAGTVDFCGLPW